METDLLYSEKKDTLEIKIKKINEKYSAFYATYCTFQNGLSVEKVSEGIQTQEKLNLAIERCFLPKAIEEFIYKDAEFLELVRLYGHPDTLSEKESYDGFTPFFKVNHLIKSLQVKFNDDIDDSIFDKLLFISNSSHTIIDMANNKLINTARFSQNMCFNSLYYKNYKNHVNRLIAESRIKILDSIGNETFKETIFDDDDYYYLNAKINFTDDEFDLILSYIQESNDLEYPKGHINDYIFHQILYKLDLFNMSEDNIKENFNPIF